MAFSLPLLSAFDITIFRHNDKLCNPNFINDMRITPQEAANRLCESISVPISSGNGKRKAKGTNTITFVKSHGDPASPTLYDFATPDGHIITTPADSDLPPILANYEAVDGNPPPALKDWLDSYNDEINWWQSVGHDLDMEFAALPEVTTVGKTIGPLINCHWHQTAPYNQLTVFGGETCMTGCWATAMAQLAYYWGCQKHDGKYYRVGCTDLDAYKTKTTRKDISGLPSIAIFDFDNMPSGKPTTAAQKAAVAQLMLYCGCAMKMNYAPGSSGAYISDLPAVLRENLRMGNPILIQASSGMDAFARRIIAELEAGRPCLFRGSGDDGGHAFICDGFNPVENLFHFNWGWGGKYDGWFALSAMKPSHYNFTSNKKAVVNIQPKVWGDVNGDGEVTVSDAMAIQKQILTGNKTLEGDANYDGDVNVADMMMVVGKTLEG